MSDLQIQQGDTLPVVQATALNAAGAVQPIVIGSTARFQMQPIDSATLVVNAPATIVDFPGGKLRYDWAPGDTATAGDYTGWFVVTGAGGAPIQTFPTDPTEPFTIEITPRVPAAPGPDLGPLKPWTSAARVREVPNVDPTRDLTDDIAAASEQLFILSGRRFPGRGQVTIRPSHANWAGANHGPADMLWGYGLGYVGRRGAYAYSPGGGWVRYWVPTINLGHQARQIVSIKIDGQVVAPSTYRLDRKTGELVRLADPVTRNNPGWPCCGNRDDLPDTAPGTFVITYSYGADPPMAGIRAATELAAAYATGNLVDLVEEGSMYDDWRTGLYWVDQFLNAMNPNRLQRRARAMSVDVPRHRVIG